jgi:hypothetical protein
MKRKSILTVIGIIVSLVCFGAGCDTRKNKGTLKINLTDQPANYEDVYITFSEVSVHRGGSEDNETDSGWIVLNDEEQGFDLLTLQGGKFELLAQADLDEGVYTQIRLKIVDGNDENGEPRTYVKVDGEKHALNVPSGSKSGLKLIHSFSIDSGSETVLYLDFDAEKSINETGSGRYQLKPTIAVLSELLPIQGEQGISGSVVDAASGDPIEGAVVVPSGSGGSAVTNEDGEFSISLPSGSYILEVTADGYEAYTSGPVVVDTQFVELESPIQLTPVGGIAPGDDDDEIEGDDDDDDQGDDDDDTEGDDDDDQVDEPGTKLGILKINLTDAPAEYEEVYITFTEVSIHKGEDNNSDMLDVAERKNGDDNETDDEDNETDDGDNETDDDQDDDDDDDDNDEDDDGEDNGGGWIILSDEEQGFDLLTLQNGNFDLLAEAALEAGVYTQIRLKIDDGEDENGEPKTYVKVDGVKHALTIPSGTKSGLKLIHPFTITADNETVLYIDFDAEKSVKQTGNGRYQLKPTISILTELPSTQEEQGVAGTVQDADTEEPIPEAAVSAYVDTDNSSELKASSITNDEGYFKMLLSQGTYTLMIDASGYEPFSLEDVEVETTLIELEPIYLIPVND